MSDTIQLRNARAVVTMWSKGEHRHAWGEEAKDARPSELFTHAAEAFGAIRRAADDQADQLRGYGFMPSHSEVKELRKIASLAAQRATRHLSWAGDLAIAEAEIMP